jgi:4-amino-4-deoxy-L-arabinose transferase-like glycosyltransferase
MFVRENLKYSLILLGLSCVFFFLGNNVLGLTNPDEVFYAQTAKEMAQRDSWTTPFLFGAPQFEKPILLYWLLRVSYMVMGAGAFAWRFFPAVFATIGVLLTYSVATLMFEDKRKGFVSALVLMSSGLYIGLGRTVYTDMIFSVFILLALAFFWMAHAKPTREGLGSVLFFVFAGLAVLTKGPLGLVLPLLTVVLFLSIRGELRLLSHRSWLIGLLLFLALAVPWYALMIKRHGGAFTSEFFYNDHIRRLLEAEHPQNDNWYFYPLSSVMCMFPWSIPVAISLLGLLVNLMRKLAQPAHLFLACWIAVMIVVFQPAHSKLVSYIFPVVPALAILAGDLLCGWAGSNAGRGAGGAGARSVSARGSGARVVASAFVLTAMVAPAGLAVGIVKYPGYLPLGPWVYVLAVLCLAQSAVIIVLAARRRFLESAYVMSPLLVMLFFFGLASPNIDSRLSSRTACQYLLRHDLLEKRLGNRAGNRILCSKYFARGVYYYTERNVTVVDMGGTNFFSPHPIPYLNSDDEVREFLRSQAVTLCVVDESSLRNLQRIADPGMRLTVMNKLGNEYVVTVAAD